MQDVFFSDWGRMDYKTAWDRQEALLKENVEIKAALRNQAALTENPSAAEGLAMQEPGVAAQEVAAIDLQTTNHLIFVEHSPVYTLGKSGKEEHVLIGEAERLA